MLTSLLGIIRRIRPAPLQVFLLTLFRLNSRRVIEYNGLKFFADPTSQFGSHLVAGEYEPEILALLEKYLGPGSNFLDLGANEGFFSVIASKIVGPSGRVVAVEPQKRLGPVILENLALNRCSNCTILQAALSNHSGEIAIFLSPTTNTGSTSTLKTAKYPLKKQIVQSYSLKDLLDSLSITTFDLVKVDIEGAEYDVFMAATDVLRSGRLKRIELEFHSSILRKRGLSEEVLDAHMRQYGYILETEAPRVYAFQQTL
jgi:FkbM family methyltransferase